MDDELEYHIRHRAYELWVQSGRPDGKHLEFWEEAEREMLARQKKDLNGAADAEAHRIVKSRDKV